MITYKQKKRERIEVPDVLIESGDDYGDILKIYIRQKNIVFSCGIDGTGNCFEIPKDKLRELIK